MKIKFNYYAGVNRDSVVELNKKIGELESKSLTLGSNNLDIDPPDLKVFINSGGGSITAGISSMDTKLRCKVPVTTICRWTLYQKQQRLYQLLVIISFMSRNSMKC